MNAKERFEHICGFGKPDRPLKWETLGFWDSTIVRWHKEGMPADIRREEMEKHFDMDPRPKLPVNGGLTLPPLYPQFEPSIIEDTDEFTIGRNENGLTYKKPKQGAEPGTCNFFDFPLKTRRDWEDIKWRLDAETHPYGDLEKIAEEYNGKEYPNCMTLCGLYGMPRMLMGEEALSYMYFDDPELVHEIQRHWLQFYSGMVKKVSGHVRIDYLLFWEDMAFKNGPLISPELFKTFMQPYYRDFISYCKGLGIRYFSVDSDGNNDVLLPLFIEAGVNIFLPFEVPAGNDVLQVRERYPDLVIWGGIDKRRLFGDSDSIRREVDRVVPAMWESGGYIPCLDHSTPPNVSLRNWEFYLEYIRSLFSAVPRN